MNGNFGQSKQEYNASLNQHINHNHHNYNHNHHQNPGKASGNVKSKFTEVVHSFLYN